MNLYLITNEFYLCLSNRFVESAKIVFRFLIISWYYMIVYPCERAVLHLLLSGEREVDVPPLRLVMVVVQIFV